MLSDKISNEKDEKIVWVGNFVAILMSLFNLRLSSGLFLDYDIKRARRSFCTRLKTAYVGGYVVTEYRNILVRRTLAHSENTSGGKSLPAGTVLPEVGTGRVEAAAMMARFMMALSCVLVVADLYQLGSNLYHNPSLEKTRALARIQKALS